MIAPSFPFPFEVTTQRRRDASIVDPTTDADGRGRWTATRRSNSSSGFESLRAHPCLVKAETRLRLLGDSGWRGAELSTYGGGLLEVLQCAQAGGVLLLQTVDQYSIGFSG